MRTLVTVITTAATILMPVLAWGVKVKALESETAFFVAAGALVLVVWAIPLAMKFCKGEHSDSEEVEIKAKNGATIKYRCDATTKIGEKNDAPQPTPAPPASPEPVPAQPVAVPATTSIQPSEIQILSSPFAEVEKKKLPLLCYLIPALIIVVGVFLMWLTLPESEQSKKDRQHRVAIAHHIKMAKEINGKLTAWDHVNIGFLHEHAGYYAEALASYEEAERLGFGVLPTAKEACRRALAGDTAMVDARRAKQEEIGRSVVDILMKSIGKKEKP